MALLITGKKTNMKKRIDIIKDIHRKKLIEKIDGPVIEKEQCRLESKECLCCGSEFTPEYYKTKYCSKCRPERDAKIYIDRAKEWEPLLKKKFQNKEFFKEDVYKFFDFKYSLGIVKRTLLSMSRHGNLKLIRGSSLCHTNRYVFKKDKK